MSSSFANDLWWANYTTARHQAILVDVVNAALTTRSSGSLDLLKTSVGKTYTTLDATTAVHPTYVRRLVLNELTTIEFAVSNLRQLSGYQSLYMFTQHCWADMDHRFEMAHTVARQRRCRQRYADNGAVYLESLLRNQDWDEFMHNYGTLFQQGLEFWVTKIAGGAEWVEATRAASTWTTEDAEVRHWRDHNVTHFQMQWLNFWQPGITETMVVANAWGMEQEVVLKRVSRSDESWTSMSMFWMPLNDFSVYGAINESLVRPPGHAPVVDTELFLGLFDADPTDYTNQTNVFRTAVGPFNSVDVMYVPVPASVLALYDAFKTTLYKTFATQPVVCSAVDAIPDVSVPTAPPAWSPATYDFHGGSPLCLYNPVQNYVQQPFGFYDICATYSPLAVGLTKYASVFAALALDDPGAFDTCRASSGVHLDCVRTVDAAVAITRSLLPPMNASLRAAAGAAINDLSVGLMQFATVKSSSPHGTGPANWTLLHHPLLQDPHWAYFGWVMVFNWIEGSREVVSFEGDVSTLVLISMADLPDLVSTSGTTVKSATRVLSSAVVYTTAIISVIAVWCVGAAVFCRGDVHGQNLIWFNRIVGAIWVGRSLLVVRGVAAVFLLSSTQLDVATDDGHSALAFSPRSVPATLVVAGEATWLAYVANDFLSAFTSDFTAAYAPLSCGLAWAAIAALELTAPVLPEAALNRKCSSVNMGQSVVCASARVDLGSLRRVFVIVAVQSGALVVTFGLGKALSSCRRKSKDRGFVRPRRHSLGMADSFLAVPATDSDANWSVDVASGLMAGLVHFEWRNTSYTFDVKLWIVKAAAASKETLSRVGPTAPPPHTTKATEGFSIYLEALGTVVAVLYVAASLIGSASYLHLSKVTLANDLFWALFNMTGVHSFTANWLNEQLVLGVAHQTVPLTADHINQRSVGGLVNAPSNYGAMIQYSELNVDLERIIAGLRTTPGCAVPWVFTQYCYMDFNQRWELANSAARQARCRRHMTSNAAVFIEALLRNVEFASFERCWGDSFASAIARELRASEAGKAWLGMVAGDVAPVAAELQHWADHGLTRFDTQWQNFKRIGFTNQYSAVNMFGTAYPFTLQHQPTAFRLKKQTTFKLYWGWANDLSWVSNGTALGGGRSLVRSSASYAFANTTIEAALQWNQTLPTPHARTFSIVRSVLGPFGSIDSWFVPCPAVVLDTVQGILQSLRRTLSSSRRVQEAFYSIPDPSGAMIPIPKAWSDINFIAVGGSPLCPEFRFQSSLEISVCLNSFLAFDMQCTGAPIWTVMVPTRESLVVAALLALVTNSQIAAICAQDFQFIPACTAFLNATLAFLAQHMEPNIALLQQWAEPATAAVRHLDIQLIQFGQTSRESPVTLHHLNILDPTQVEFTFFAWNFLMDWALGRREAIRLEGDDGSLTLLSEYLAPLSQPVNMAELPVNFAMYMRSSVLYVTVAMMGLASLALFYVLASKGHIEVLNLLELQRVGAIVWVGRPLLFVRSLTAIGLLSTCTLQLRTSGFIEYFTEPSDPWYTVALAANEVTWLVAIVNDMAMVMTQEYTQYYATLNSVVVWMVTTALSGVVPPSHSFVIAKDCRATQVGLLVECHSGRLVVGHVTRLLVLAGVVLAANGVCYVLTRAMVRRPRIVHGQSLFLYSGARYLYCISAWSHESVYFMDRVSAALNGILTLRVGHQIYCFDVKLWQSFVVCIAPTTNPSMVPKLRAAAAHALPLKLS